MAKVIAVYNQKGGVGKTTSAVNLTGAVGALGKRCLLVDIDAQGNATSGLGIDRREVERSVYDVLMGGCEPHEAVRTTEFANVDILPGDQSLAGIEVELVTAPRRENRLRGALAPLREQYDYIFIDCPPSIGLLSLNALCAADTVIIPIQCEFYALEGLSQVMGSLREAKRLYNPTLEIEGVLLTMFDGRLNQTQQVVHEIKRFFPRKLFSATIPRTVRLSEAPSFGQPINYYDPSSRGAAAYRAVAEELIGPVRR